MYQKSALLGPRTAEFVKENLPFVLENTRVKYEQLYQTRYWNYNFYCFFLALVVFWWKKRLSPASALLLAAAFFLVTIVPASGLFILRYSVPCIPFYALINGSLYGLAIEAAGRRLIPLEKEKEALHE